MRCLPGPHCLVRLDPLGAILTTPGCDSDSEDRRGDTREEVQVSGKKEVQGEVWGGGRGEGGQSAVGPCEKSDGPPCFVG